MRNKYFLLIVCSLLLRTIAAQNPSLISDINAESLVPTPDYYGSLNVGAGQLFFNATDDHGFGLWRSDGTEAGTNYITTQTLVPSYAGTSIDYKGALYYADDNSASLWKTDGTAQGTELISPATIVEYSGAFFNYFATANGILFFGAEANSAGNELWKSDGTPQGTMMVKDISEGTSSSDPVYITSFQNKVLFNAYSGQTGIELYVSDGTAGGTILVKDIVPGTGSSYPNNLVEYNGMVYFFADDGTNPAALWKTDGTEAGTAEVKVFDPEDMFAGGLMMAAVNGKLLIYAYINGKGYELWSSDGTTDGTQLLYDIYPGKNSSNYGFPPFPFFVNGNYAYFTAEVSVNHEQLWRSDGTEAGTGMVADLDGAAAYNFASLPNGKIVFTTYPYSNDVLWVTDGTPGGTASINQQFFPRQELVSLAPFDGKVFFVARDAGGGINATKLCYTDGTTEGTQQFPITTTETFSSYPSQMVKVEKDNYVFTATDGIHGTELWGTNGTAGTILLKDIVNGSQSTAIKFCPQSINGEVLFGSPDTIIGSFYSDYKLYRTNGTLQGTVALKSCNPYLILVTPF